jgi:hypothetical protein
MPKPRAPISQTIGGILAGIDQQILRWTPPPHELVRKGEAVRGVTGDDGSNLAIVLPEALPARGEAPPEAEPPVSSDGPRRSRSPA